MKNFFTTFRVNRHFLIGLLSGVFITALVFLLIFSADLAAPDKHKMKGTMSASSFYPYVGATGIVEGAGSICGKPFNDVIFDQDNTRQVFRCHGNAGPNQPVIITNLAAGDFCANGGIVVSFHPPQN